MKVPSRLVWTLTTTGLVVRAATVAACPVCFGASDSPMAAGLNAGIGVLFGVTVGVLGAIAVVGVRLARLAGSVEVAGSAGSEDPAPRLAELRLSDSCGAGASAPANAASGTGARC